MKTSRISLLASGLCVFVSLFLASCAAPAANQAERAAARGGSLVYRLSSPPSSLNYVMAPDEATVLAGFFMLTSRLAEFDHKAQKYGPGIAESWQMGPDGQALTVKLRGDAKFSDGRDITADDVVFTLAAIYDEKTNSPAWKDAMLIGGKPIAARVVDAKTVELTFPEKVAAVDNYLGNIGVLPSHVLKPELDGGRFSQAWKLDSDLKGIVSSGAFIVESAAAGERVVFARNPNYWKKDTAGTQLPYLDKVTLEIVTDPNNAMARLSQETLDIIDRIRPTDAATLSSQPGAIKPTDLGPGLGTDHLWFNQNAAKANDEKLEGKPKYTWFTDKRFRRAVAHAIDRATIATSTLRGLATPIYGFISPGNRVWAKGDLPKIDLDLDRAAQLLAEAKFEKRGTPESPELFDANGNRVEFTLLVPAENEPRKLMAAVIQQDLAKLGIKMAVVPLEFQKVNETWAKSFDYDAILAGLSITDIEPSSLSNFIRSGAAAHQWHPGQKAPATEWESRIDTLFAQQATESDIEKRKTAIAEIQTIMSEEMPVIPIVARHVVSASNQRVGNLAPSTIFPYSLWNVEELFVK